MTAEEIAAELTNKGFEVWMQPGTDVVRVELTSRPVSSLEVWQALDCPDGLSFSRRGDTVAVEVTPQE